MGCSPDDAPPSHFLHLPALVHDFPMPRPQLNPLRARVDDLDRVGEEIPFFLSGKIPPGM